MNKEEELQKLEDQLEIKRRHAAKAMEPLKKQIEELKKLLKSSNKCKHTKTSEFKWEWDNGYGTQKMLPGLRCKSCGKENHWPGSSNHWS